jgi:hypothetical protein
MDPQLALEKKGWSLEAHQGEHTGVCAEMMTVAVSFG